MCNWLKSIGDWKSIGKIFKNFFEKNELEEAKFLFQKNLVFDPKNSDSYLYLGKIYKIEENEKETEKNLKTTLLLDPNNEEAMLMMMKIAIEQSNYDKVKNMSDTFSKVCKNLCNENQEIKESLKNIDPKNESWSKSG